MAFHYEWRTFTCPECKGEASAEVRVFYAHQGRGEALKGFECENNCDLDRDDVKVAANIGR